MVSVTIPSLPMVTKALGVNVRWAAAGVAPTPGKCMPSTKLPAAPRPAFRNTRRETGASMAYPFAAVLMAARMREYVPQRQILPDMAASMSASDGLGLEASSALALMIWPDWQ